MTKVVTLKEASKKEAVTFLHPYITPQDNGLMINSPLGPLRCRADH